MRHEGFHGHEKERLFRFIRTFSFSKRTVSVRRRDLYPTAMCRTFAAHSHTTNNHFHARQAAYTILILYFMPHFLGKKH